MAIIEDIKCSRCDRKYSGVRSRCPYCGARRIGKGKYSDTTSNTKGKMLISVLILGVFTVAAAVLLFTTEGDGAGAGVVVPPPDEIHADEDEGLEVEATPTPTPPPTPEPTPPPLVPQQLTITFDGNPRPDGFTIFPGETIPLRVRIEPPGAGEDLDIMWESSNTDAFTVTPVAVNDRIGIGANVVHVGSGSGTLTVWVGDLSKTIHITAR